MNDLTFTVTFPAEDIFAKAKLLSPSLTHEQFAAEWPSFCDEFQASIKGGDLLELHMASIAMAMLQRIPRPAMHSAIVRHL